MIENKFAVFRNGQLFEVLDPVHEVVMIRARKDDWLYFASSSVEDRMWIHKLTDEKERIVIGRDFVICNEDAVPEDIKLQVLLLQ